MEESHRWVRRAALVVAVALIGASCGDDDDQSRTVEDTTSSTPEASASQEAGTESTETSTTTTEAPAPSAMDSVVVSLQDLPTGWTASTPEEDEKDDEICDGHDPFNAVEPVEEAESHFEQGSFGPFLSSVAGRYASADDAQGVLDAVADAVDQCQTFTDVDDDGNEMTYTFAALSFPKLGDDTYAARLSATTPIGPLALDFALARDGDAVVAVINGGLGAADTALTESMLRLMVHRL